MYLSEWPEQKLALKISHEYYFFASFGKKKIIQTYNEAEKKEKNLKLYSVILAIASQGVIDIKCIMTATANKTKTNRMFR